MIADNDASQWDGDSADPIITDAYAYGARRFDVKEALTMMVHGATVPASGFAAERPNLTEYEAHGWVPQLTYDVTSYPYTDGASETLAHHGFDIALRVPYSTLHDIEYLSWEVQPWSKFTTTPATAVALVSIR